ncbi:MAG: saccharopine dehydrogenase C-terminal domain-containing protein, partial [Chitinophaga rupis]
MTKILLFGAGKSATCLIRYLVRETASRGWELIVAESNLSLAQSKVGTDSHAKAVAIQVENEPERDALIQDAAIVISLLPPALHYLVAVSCVKWGKDLLTASYLDKSIKALEPAIREKGLLFIGEMGLDPGIDHMSAMQFIHRIKANKGQILSFRSHTGGLVAPGSDNNPWHYKISWNPRNVVTAGSAGARYKENGQVIGRSYQQLFEACGQVEVEGLDQPLSWYPNRDSLSYIPLYGLEEVGTFIRTTLRYSDFCR